MICSLQEVHYAYDKNVPVLSGISADFLPNQVVAVCGSNGVGKSTLLNIIALDIAPDSGNVKMFADSITENNKTQMRRKIGMLPQNPFIFSGTVLDNMNLGLRFHGVPKGQRRDLAMQQLQRFGLDKMADAMATKLSGGQKQRLAFARILALKPQILLLDEPFTYLDSEMTEYCAEILRNPGSYGLQLAIFTTHNNQHIETAHAIVHLSAGKARLETVGS